MAIKTLTKEKLERKIRRTYILIESTKNEHGDNPNETHNYYGGWSLGYLQGKLAALEDLSDELFDDESA